MSIFWTYLLWTISKWLISAKEDEEGEREWQGEWERERGRQRGRTVKICSEDMFVPRQMALQSSKSHTWKFWLSICNNKLLTVSVWVCICIHMRVYVYANTSKRLSQQRQSENCQLNKKRPSLHMLRYTHRHIHTHTYTHIYIHTCINGPCYVLPIFRFGFFFPPSAHCVKDQRHLMAWLSVTVWGVKGVTDGVERVTGRR